MSTLCLKRMITAIVNYKLDYHTSSPSAVFQRLLTPKLDIILSRVPCGLPPEFLYKLAHGIPVVSHIHSVLHTRGC